MGNIFEQIQIDEGVEKIKQRKEYYRFLDKIDPETANDKERKQLSTYIDQLGITVDEAIADREYVKQVRQWQSTFAKAGERQQASRAAEAAAIKYNEETVAWAKIRHVELFKLFGIRDAAKNERHKCLIAQAELKKAKADVLAALGIEQTLEA